ncbi:superinfection immunity protein [Hymenobacter guriensis]|uniref:Superinfection immunity protein n=1 Tax=Hymenobacter guriensis TaxID=2793065 RepID=A0ABS0L9E7_9BACT|nr:superinfection immunity protein [Hymenobacter guriensis]MBG8556154.1 superinfection immunity protein [Hymenobacter guriensis]
MFTVLLLDAEEGLGITETIGAAIAFGIYFLPAIIGRNHRQSGSIALLNLLLGWTIIGWIAALIWSVSTPTPVIVQQAPPAPKENPSVADELLKLSQLRDTGVLSEEEYQQQRTKALSR